MYDKTITSMQGVTQTTIIGTQNDMWVVKNPRFCRGYVIINTCTSVSKI